MTRTTKEQLIDFAGDEPEERAAFEAWWEQFAAEHEEWRFADSHALRWQAWQARAAKGQAS